MSNLLELYKKLYNLTEKQKQEIISSNYDKLLQVLDEKQQLMNKINEIDVQGYLQKQDNPPQALQELSSLLSKLKELEDETAVLIKKKYGDMKSKLKEINKRQKSRKGYQASSKFEAKFIDKKG